MSSSPAPHPSSIARFIGRHLDKQFDLHAFPRSAGYPALQRGQMRYIGAGGSPKVDDPNTLPPEHFTLSMIDLPVDHYGASHYHDDCEEIFLMLDGKVTVGMAWDDEVIETFLGPKDMIMLPIGRPHGYRNDTSESVRFSVMVGNKRPNMPIYVAHPSQSEYGSTFGAAPGKTLKHSPASDDPRHREFSSYLCRYSQQPVNWHPAGFASRTYVGEGALKAGNFRADLVHLPRGAGVKSYCRPVEDAYLVLEGVVTVGWEVDGKVVESRLGPKDVILNPAGQPHYFRNEGCEDAQFMLVAGNDPAEQLRFEAR